MNLKGKLELIDAIYEATTSLQFVEYSKKYLLEKGFVELKENEKWGDIPSKYFVTRNDKSLIVVNGTEKSKGLIICSEISTPCLQAKPNCFDTHNGYNGVRCAYSEYYHSYNPSNSLLCTSGQIFYHENEDDQTLHRKLFKTNYPVGRLMPSASPGNYLHDNPEDAYVVNLTLDSSDDVSESHPTQSKALLDIIEHETGVKASQIVDFDAYFYDYHKPQLAGAEQQWITGNSCGQVGVSITNLRFIAETEPHDETLISYFYTNTHNMYSHFSNFLSETLERSGYEPEFLANSLRIYLDLALDESPTFMGKGPVILSSQERAGFTERSAEVEVINKLKNRDCPINISSLANYSSKLYFLGQDQVHSAIPTITMAIFGVSDTPFRNTLFDPADLITLRRDLEVLAGQL